ncbi:MAG: hypothetical protein IJO60_03495 [Agathobacter sp.]|nr:hypothetical protein [Agathobacter sp.]
MAKYDDFGRPIYETAEEYNQAHKTGDHSRTYDSPEGNAYKHNPAKNIYLNQKSKRRNMSRTGAKKSNSVIFRLAICMICCIVGALIGFNTVRNSVGSIYEVVPENVEDVVINTDDEYAEFNGGDETPLPDGFETFSYNGQVYSLPTTMEEIAQMGLSLEEPFDEMYMIPTDYEETLMLNNEDGLMSAMIRVSNYTGEEIPLGKCQVIYFYIENPVAYNEEAVVPDFVFGGGCTFNSSYEELESYFGTPYSHYEDHSEEGYYYDSYQWAYYGEDETHFVNVTFWNGAISNVEIEKRVIEAY